MRRILVAICIIFSCVAYADTTLTSKNYVDDQVATKQDIVPAKDTNTVLTHTGESGNIGEKGIYDSTGTYAGHSTELVTAGVADAAIQNAIDTEFVWVEWLENDEHTDANCLGWQIRNHQKNLLDPKSIHQGTIVGATGKWQSVNSRCYFDYIPVKAGDKVNFIAHNDSPPVHHAAFLYSDTNEESWIRRIEGTAITIGNHKGYRFSINTNGYIRGLFLTDHAFTPAEIKEAQVEISETPTEYEMYHGLYIPQNQ